MQEVLECCNEFPHDVNTALPQFSIDIKTVDPKKLERILAAESTNLIKIEDPWFKLWVTMDAGTPYARIPDGKSSKDLDKIEVSLRASINDMRH